MRGPARLLAMLAFAAATQVAAAADRFVPADPAFVVANVRQVDARRRTARRCSTLARGSGRRRAVVALAAAFIERARSAREPTYFGRAEAVLAPLAREPPARVRDCAGCMPRSCSTGTISRRGESLLDALLREAPRDADARLLRASVRLVRGELSRARAAIARSSRRAAAKRPAIGLRLPRRGARRSRQISNGALAVADFRVRADGSADACAAPICSRRAPSCASARDPNGAIARLPRGADTRAAR